MNEKKFVIDPRKSFAGLKPPPTWRQVLVNKKLITKVIEADEAKEQLEKNNKPRTVS